ncbi:hypothetical protein MTO96_003318 [Rhipicephalus appendiculatus]
MQRSDNVQHQVIFIQVQDYLNIPQGIMERANTNARRAQWLSAPQVLNHCDFRRESILPHLIPECWTGEAEQPLLHPPQTRPAASDSTKRCSQRRAESCCSHRPELEDDGLRVAVPSSRLSVFSKVHLHEHSGDNDQGLVSERSQRMMATFGST